MKHFLISFLVLFFMLPVLAQNKLSADQIRQQMAKIRQTTNWNDPAAAKKANEEIKKLAGQLNGGKPAVSFSSPSQPANPAPVNYISKTTVSPESTVAIADRFYKRAYKALDAISKNQFDLDYKKAVAEKFSLKAVRQLTTTGALLITFGNDHNLACVYP